MVERKGPFIPEWAQQERGSDLVWVGENLDVFWAVAQRGYREQGRGAIVVDTTQHPTGKGNPFLYLPEAEIEKLQDADALRMVRSYNPGQELVTMLLKRAGRVSSYRIGLPSIGQETGSR